MLPRRISPQARRPSLGVQALSSGSTSSTVGAGRYESERAVPPFNDSDPLNLETGRRCDGQRQSPRTAPPGFGLRLTADPSTHIWYTRVLQWAVVVHARPAVPPIPEP